MRTITLLCLLLSFWSCSSQDRAGGNSAEVGSPELAGILTLPDGSPAAAALVACVPKHFLVNANDSLPLQSRTLSDSLGEYRMDSLPVGTCALEVYDPASGMRLYVPGLVLDSGSHYMQNQVLKLPGSVRIGVDLPDGDSVVVLIPGTDIRRVLEVKFGSVFVDSLPAGILEGVFIVPAHGDTLKVDSALSVQPGQELSVETIPIVVQLEVPLRTDALGILLQDTLFGFPLLVRLHAGNWDFGVLTPAAGLLRIAKKGRAKDLPFRIARWDAEAKAAEIWVRIDTLLPNSASQALTMSWSEGTPTTPSTLAPLPFSSEDGYVASWHFDEGATTATDAGSLGFDGTVSGVAVSAGAIGNAFYFDGHHGTYVSIPGSASGPFNFGFSDSMCISAWVNMELANTSRFIWGKGAYQYHLKFQYPSGWLVETNDASTPSYRYVLNAPMDSVVEKGNWVFLTVVQKGTHMEFYHNDSLADSTASVGLSAVQRYEGSAFEIGRSVLPDGSVGQSFLGSIDEVQVSRVPRSQEWVRLQYYNQRPKSYWPDLVTNLRTP